MYRLILTEGWHLSVKVIRYVTRPFNPLSKPHVAATNKGTAVITFKMVQATLDIGYIGRSRGGCCRCAPPPQQDPILSFLHMFLPKRAHFGGHCPPNGSAPPPPPNGKSWIRHWGSVSSHRAHYRYR